MRAMVQLPGYLERVLAGGRDLALVLLPLLNDLRAVRGSALLSEGTLLLLNLKSDRQAQPAAPAPGEPPLTVAQWARRLRAALPDRTGGLDPRRARRAEPRDPRGGARRASSRWRRSSRCSSCGGSSARCSRRCARTAWRAAYRSSACSGWPIARLKRLYETGRGALRAVPADRTAEQPPLLHRARRQRRPARRRRARLVPAGGTAAGRRVGRAGAREPLGTVGQADADRGGRDPRGPVARQGRARHLRPPGRRPGRGAEAAARDAAQDRRHAGRARPRANCARRCRRRPSGSRPSSAARSSRRTRARWCRWRRPDQASRITWTTQLVG